jgi:hypothetical protein
VILHNMTVEVRRCNFTFNDLRKVQHNDDDNQQLDNSDDEEGGNHGRRQGEGGQPYQRGEGGQPYQSTSQRGDGAHEDNDEQAFRDFFQSASEEVASTILAGRIGHMTVSIEDEHKHIELFKDLQEHIHNNYVGAEREYSNT